MSKLLSTLLASTPLSATFRLSKQDPSDSEPLMLNGGKGIALDEPTSEKCELRIEGMTCGACVEVSRLNDQLAGRI